MTLFVTSLMTILLIAWVLDFLMSDAAVMKWRSGTVALRAKFFELNVIDLTVASNVWFLGFFEAVYDRKFLSRRRIVASAASTLLAMVIVSLLIEVNGWPAFHVLFRGFISALLIITIVNFVADYLSLQETYWIMKKSQNRKLLGIVILVILDIVLTGIIYTVTVLFFVFLGINFSDFFEFIFELFPEPKFYLVSKSDGVGIFLIILASSTYITSTLWIGFAVSAVGLRFLQVLSPTLRRVIRVIGESEKPAMSTAGFICLLTTTSVGTYRIALWLVG